jgi:hypothetical protein
LRLSLADPQYALKTAWRFVGLVSFMSLLPVFAPATTRWWIHVHEAAWFVFAILFCMSVVLVVCFAFAGFVWAACAPLPRSSLRRAASRALLAALAMLLIVGSYALVLTGVIRLH